MLTSFILFAEEEVNKTAEPVEFWRNPIILLPVMFGLFYFIVLRPQQRKQRQEQENLMANLKKNDEVVTTSGIIGIVANIKEGGNEVTLKIDDNARIRVLRSTIAQIMKKDEPAGAAAATPPSTGIKPTA